MSRILIPRIVAASINTTMTWWDITKEVVDWILRAGGLLAGATLLIQTFLKGWITDHFATKKEVRSLTGEMQKISAGATSSLRVAAVSKIIELRFSGIQEIQTEATSYLRSLTAIVSAVEAYFHFKEEAERAGQLNMLEEKCAEKRAQYYDASRKLLTTLQLQKAHIPQSLWEAGNRVWILGGEAFGLIVECQIRPPEDLTTPVAIAMADFGDEIENAIKSVPDLANEIYPEKAKADSNGE
jgi:hypothetical protein